MVYKIRHANVILFFFFFFQAEDGIRDYKVTGVQTCALPISGSRGAKPMRRGAASCAAWAIRATSRLAASRLRMSRGRWARAPASSRRAGSGERRGGEEGRSRGAPDHLKKKK